MLQIRSTFLDTIHYREPCLSRITFFTYSQGSVRSIMSYTLVRKRQALSDSASFGLLASKEIETCYTPSALPLFDARPKISRTAGSFKGQSDATQHSTWLHLASSFRCSKIGVSYVNASETCFGEGKRKGICTLSRFESDCESASYTACIVNRNRCCPCYHILRFVFHALSPSSNVLRSLSVRPLRDDCDNVQFYAALYASIHPRINRSNIARKYGTCLA